MERLTEKANNPGYFKDVRNLSVPLSCSMQELDDNTFRRMSEAAAPKV